MEDGELVLHLAPGISAFDLGGTLKPYNRLRTARTTLSRPGFQARRRGQGGWPSSRQTFRKASMLFMNAGRWTASALRYVKPPRAMTISRWSFQASVGLIRLCAAAAMITVSIIAVGTFESYAATRAWSSSMIAVQPYSTQSAMTSASPRSLFGALFQRSSRR